MDILIQKCLKNLKWEYFQLTKDWMDFGDWDQFKTSIKNLKID